MTAGCLRGDDLMIERSASTAQGGRAAGRLLLERGDRRPTAIFCFNDEFAMGVYQASAALGLRVPDDVSVIGVDDLPLVADALDPGLTTVTLPHEEMGRCGAEELMARIANPEQRVERARRLHHLA